MIVGDTDTLTGSKLFKDIRNPDAVIPSYVKNSSEDNKVSIICPVLSDNGEELYGIVNYEFRRKPLEEKLDVLVNNLVNLSRAIVRLDYLYERYAEKVSTVHSLLKTLKSFSSPNFYFTWKVFFSYPKGTPDIVIESILSAINSFGQRIKLLTWKDARSAGAAQKKLREDIKSSHFIIGYISEPNKEQSNDEYKDNVNVMLELAAKYFHDDKSALGIRELNSVKELPFNFRDMQLVMTDRDDHNNLNASKLKEEVLHMVEKAINPDNPE